jgi:hypothetical protein
MTAFYKQSWFAPVASAATTFLFPSLGNAVGGALNGVVGGAMSEGVANALGSAGVGGLIGGLSNGTQGALTGALAGGGTSALMSATGLTGGLTGLLNNGSFAGQPAAAASAVTGGLRDSNIATTNGVTGGNAAAAANNTASNAAGGALGMFGNGKGGISPALIAGLALAGTMGGSLMGGNKSGSGQNPQQGAPPTDPSMTRGLSQVAFNRSYRAPEGDLKKYGMQGGQHRFYDNNQVPTVAAADGGRVRGPHDHEKRGIPAEGMQRSESVQHERGRRDIRANPRPSMMHHLLRPEQAALREAMWQRGAEATREAGPYPTDYGMMPQRPGASPTAPPGFLSRIPGAFDQFEQPYARGGVAGPGHGREDAIPAVLSDGEYVIDAETVALLGDGSSKAGAQKLDQMRMQIRKHKGGALSRGQISPDAKPAIAYAGVR